MVLRCFGEEKGKAGKRESGVNLGGGGDRRCFYTLDTFFLNTSPLNGSCIRGTWVVAGSYERFKSDLVSMTFILAKGYSKIKSTQCHQYST
ncbi:hypothetical protein VN97_g4756 [Penicillium thymicola]|uniref:Uncharacterized protein n=1 Tax=Penicillium thymicola TaxID=293382 RepID=A0AAI9TL72_PENTH|nr:hypothetical protein VN97_g4756 [Penicillium thymicola]